MFRLQISEMAWLQVLRLSVLSERDFDQKWIQNELIQSSKWLHCHLMISKSTRLEDYLALDRTLEGIADSGVPVTMSIQYQENPLGQGMSWMGIPKD
jgi:hypothetical protein